MTNFNEMVLKDITNNNNTNNNVKENNNFSTPLNLRY